MKHIYDASVNLIDSCYDAFNTTIAGSSYINGTSN